MDFHPSGLGAVMNLFHEVPESFAFLLRKDSRGRGVILVQVLENELGMLSVGFRVGGLGKEGVLLKTRPYNIVSSP